MGLINLSRFVLQSKCFLPLFHLMIFSLYYVTVYVTFHCFMNMIDGNPMKLTTSSSLKKTWGALSWNSGVSQVTLVVKNSPTHGVNTRDQGLTPGSGQSPGEGNGNPLLQSCLKNLMDRGACQAPVHGVAKSRTWQKWLRMLSVKPEAKQKPGWALLCLDIVHLDGQSTSRSCGVHSLNWVTLSSLMVKDSKFKPFDMSLKGRESQFVEGRNEHPLSQNVDC